jgi:hypothetical protein
MLFDMERYRGRWIAVRRDDDHVVADAPSLEQLQADLRDLPDLAVLIRRVPGANDPIFVGLG